MGSGPPDPSRAGEGSPEPGPRAARRPSGRPADPPRTLIGGVGYHHLRDFAAGPVLIERLRGRSWPESVVLEDLSYDPVKVIHRLATEGSAFERLVLVGAARRGRPPGRLVAYRWDSALPDAAEIQDRVSEAVTGVISLDNLLIVVQALGEPPPEIYVVELEPEVEAMGEELSPAVEAAVERAAELVRSIALHDAARPAAPEAPLGGGATTNGHGSGPHITPFDPLRERP